MNRKQAILGEITKPACVSGEHPEDFGDVILSPYRLADYLLRLEEKMGKKSFKMEINEKGRFAPQEKNDLESRFNQMFYEPREDKRLSLLTFIKEEGERVHFLRTSAIISTLNKQVVRRHFQK